MKTRSDWLRASLLLCLSRYRHFDANVDTRGQLGHGCQRRCYDQGIVLLAFSPFVLRGVCKRFLHLFVFFCSAAGVLCVLSNDQVTFRKCPRNGTTETLASPRSTKGHRRFSTWSSQEAFSRSTTRRRQPILDELQHHLVASVIQLAIRFAGAQF